MSRLATAIIGALRDHKNGLDTAGARIVGRWLAQSRKLLIFGAYIALIYLTFSLLLDVQASLVRRIGLPHPGMFQTNAAKFYILLFSLVAPFITIALYIAIGTAYHYSADVAWRRLPRFASALFYPLVLIVLALNINSHQREIARQMAGAYVYAETVVASARGQLAVAASTYPEAGQPAHTIADPTLQQGDMALPESTVQETDAISRSDIGMDDAQHTEPVAKAYQSFLEQIGMRPPAEKNQE